MHCRIKKEFKVYEEKAPVTIANEEFTQKSIYERYFAQKDQSDELKKYIHEPVTRFSRTEDTLSYWKLNKERFPTLHSMAMDYLAIPASSAAVESAFSTAGHLFNKKRTRLKAETLESLLLLHNWQTKNFF